MDTLSFSGLAFDSNYVQNSYVVPTSNTQTIGSFSKAYCLIYSPEEIPEHVILKLFSVKFVYIL